MENTNTGEILVSVVIPAYNHASYIAQTIESVLSQDFQSFELIVIDDASEDQTAAVAERYLQDPRVTVTRNASNLGSFENNSKAIRCGSGKYFVWLHGDDYLLPGHLSDAVNALEANPHCDLAYSPCYWVDENDQMIKLARHPGHCQHNYYGGRNEIAELLAFDNYITPSSAVIRKSALDRFTGFNINIRAGDWYLFMQLALNNPNFAFIDRASTCYRIHAKQFSQGFYQSEKPLWAHIGILESVLAQGKAGNLVPWHTQIQDLLSNRLDAYSVETLGSGVDRLQSIQATMTQTLEAELTRKVSDNPLITIIITSRNMPEALLKTIQSIQGQSYSNWEAIIVDDSDTDITDALGKTGNDIRSRYFKLDREAGKIAALNTGLRFARGEIICYLEQGSSWNSDHLTEVKEAFHNNDIHALYFDTICKQHGSTGGRIVLDSVAHRFETLGLTGLFADVQGGGGVEQFIQQLSSIFGMSVFQDAPVHPVNNARSEKDSSNTRSMAPLTAHAETGENPVVSIIVPTFNRPHLLKNALESIVQQDYPHWQAIVVNDAGEDAEMVALSADPQGRVVYLCHDRNKGLSAARNTGLEHADGEIICYLDDDDIFLPNHLHALVYALKSTGAGLVYSDSEHVSQELRDGELSFKKIGNQYVHTGFSIEQLHVGNYIPVNTIAHYRSLLDVVGPFDEELSALEDWDMLLRFSRVTRIEHIPVTTVEVRVRESELDNMSIRERKGFPILYREIYERYDHLGNPDVLTQRIATLKYIDELSQNLVA